MVAIRHDDEFIAENAEEAHDFRLFESMRQNTLERFKEMRELACPSEAPSEFLRYHNPALLGWKSRTLDEE